MTEFNDCQLKNWDEALKTYTDRLSRKEAYLEKLSDPRWQKKRLEILNRDEWKCQECGDATETLHVHHLFYCGEPWETPSYALQTLCKTCHGCASRLLITPGYHGPDQFFSSAISIMDELRLKGISSGEALDFAHAIHTLSQSEFDAWIRQLPAVSPCFPPEKSDEKSGE